MLLYKTGITNVAEEKRRKKALTERTERMEKTGSAVGPGGNGGHGEKFAVGRAGTGGALKRARCFERRLFLQWGKMEGGV